MGQWILNETQYYRGEHPYVCGLETSKAQRKSERERD